MTTDDDRNETHERKLRASRAAAQLADAGSEHCKACGKPISEYGRYPPPDDPDGQRSHCIDCWRELGYQKS